MDEEAKEVVSSELKSFYNRFLAKTAFKSVIWLFIAYVFSYFFPDQEWIWYVTAALIGIAISFSLFIQLVALRARKNKDSL